MTDLEKLFYYRGYKQKERDFIVELEKNKEKQIQEYIKEHFTPVDDKPGYVWYNQRNFQIISIETLTKSLEDFFNKCITELKGETE